MSDTESVIAPRRGRPPVNRDEAGETVEAVAEAAVPPGYVRCRVLKAGDGKISTGEHLAGVGDLTYARNDVFNMPRPVGEELENRGLVEID